MKTLNQAINRAIKMAKNGEEYLVVLEKSLYDEPGNDYHITNTDDLETFFAGCTILFSTNDS